MIAGWNLRFAALVAVFSTAAILLLLSLLISPRSRTSVPGLSWAPGYWEFSPAVGMMRVVPVASCRLVNPVAAPPPSKGRE